MPVAIYLAFNAGLPSSGGWGIPMATDIAFTLGLMALLGSRVPLQLKVFVSALAIADDLGAIIVIAFFNTGILLSGGTFSVSDPVTLGVVLGLVLGKPTGIVIFLLGCNQDRNCRLPDAVSWRHMVGAGCLAGVGFTMSIFIATSAFEGDVLNGVKLSVLTASVVAAGLGLFILSRQPSAKLLKKLASSHQRRNPPN